MVLVDNFTKIKGFIYNFNMSYRMFKIELLYRIMRIFSIRRLWPLLCLCIGHLTSKQLVLHYAIILDSHLKVPQQQTFAYITLDLIQIFGRLSELRSVGSSIYSGQEELKRYISYREGVFDVGHNNYFNKTCDKLHNSDGYAYSELYKINLIPLWMHLFFESDKIDFHLFKHKVSTRLLFKWPRTYNSGQFINRGFELVPASPFVYSKVCQQLKSISNERKISLKFLDNYFQSYSIPDDALDCVFKSFSNNKDYLKPMDIIQSINDWTPDGELDWATFAYNMRDEPDDNVKNLVE